MALTRSRIAPSLLALAVLAACGEGLVEGPPVELHGDARLPPPEFADDVRSQALGGTQVVYLNFDGVTLRYGRSDATANTSWIVRSTTTFPPFRAYGGQARAEAIREIATLVEADFAPWNLRIVTERPTEGAYTMVVVGGSPRLVGESDGVAGLAPLDRGNANPSDVVFAFSEVVYTNRLVANVISHEFGHSFGLEHLRPTDDVMYPTVHDRRKRWLDDVTYDTGRRQDEPSILLALFGPRPAEEPAGDLPVDDPALDPAPDPADDPATGADFDAVGRLELVDKTWGHGFAYDPDQPDAALEVQIWFDGRYAGSLPAADPRPELVSSGALPSPDHGFAFWMPRLPRGTHTVEAYAVDTDGRPRKLVGSFRLRY